MTTLVELEPMEPKEPIDPKEINRIIRVIDAITQHRPQISPNAIIAFLMICREGTMGLADIKRELPTTPSGGTRVLSLLLEMGFIEITEDKKDRRTKYASLAPKGKRLWSSIRFIIDGD